MSQAIELAPVGEWRRRASDLHAATEREVIRLERVARGSMARDTRRAEGALRRFLRRCLGVSL